MVDDAQITAISTIVAEAHDVTALNAGDTDHVLIEFAVVASVAGHAEVVGITAEAGEVRLDLAIEAVAGVTGAVEGIVVEGQTRQGGDRLTLRILDRERRFAVVSQVKTGVVTPGIGNEQSLYG